MVLRRLRQKVRGFFWVSEETTTIVESKYLNPAKLRYSNTKVHVEVKTEWCSEKTKNGKKAKTKNGKKKNGKPHEKTNP
jgi:hypothetical protein